MRIAIALIALAVALPAGAGPAEDVAGLAWMAGSWVQSKDGVTLRETWLAPLDGVMSGVGQTNAPGKRPLIEFMTIGVGPAGATFTATLPGQPPTPFALVPGMPGELVFENRAHDFPQRVIFRRCGPDYCPRIEGMVNGKLETEAWRYRRVK